MRRNKGVLRIALIAILIGLASFGVAVYNNTVTMPSYAMIQKVFNVRTFKTTLQATTSIKEAIEIAKNTDCKGMTEKDTYNLLMSTYNQTNWKFDIDGAKTDDLRFAIAQKNYLIYRYREKTYSDEILLRLYFNKGIYSYNFDSPIKKICDVMAFEMALKSNDTFEKAIEYAENNFEYGMNDDDVYKLLSSTYDQDQWKFDIEKEDMEKLRLVIVEESNWVAYYDKQKLDYKWPPNDGFVDGTKHTKKLQVGERIDRYGEPAGRFLSPEGVPYEERALKPGTDITSNYYVYEVIKEFDVEAGKIEPWFGVKGEGTQYHLIDHNVQYYIDNGFIRKIKEVRVAN